MEPLPYHPHLKKVLKTFQVAAASSLGGPSSYTAQWAAAADHASGGVGPGGVNGAAAVAAAAAGAGKFPLDYEYEAFKKALEMETNKVRLAPNRPTWGLL